MTSEGLGEMFEGDSADTCAENYLLMSMGGRVDSGGSSVRRPRGEDPHRSERNVWIVIVKLFHHENVDILSDDSCVISG